MMNTHAVILQDGTVERLLVPQEGYSPPGDHRLVELDQEVRCWPQPPNQWAVLKCSEAGTLSWHDPRAEEQQLSDAAAEVRAQRNALLAESDWRVTKASEAGLPLDAPWQAYRQALRDISAQPGFPGDVQWPTAPA